jgi:nucleotide-binding universal stress UspA family protein
MAGRFKKTRVPRIDVQIPRSAMPPLGPITVGHDGSPDARRAARWAAGLAAAHEGTELHLVHALSMPDIPANFWDLRVDELFARHEREIRAALESERRALAELGVAVELFVRRWLPVDTLLAHARERRSGLIVVGQHGTRRSRPLLGGVSDAIAREAEMPVVVDRGRERAAPPALVLLALDGSDACARAAAAVARWFPAARVRAVRVGGEGRAGADLARVAGDSGLAAERIELVEAAGDPAERLIELADADDVDLVAAGRRGRSALAALLLGGVATKLLQLAPRPLLLAH